MLLLQHNADVCIINGDGKLPCDMTQASDSGREITKLLRAAQQTETLRKESKLLSAARDGNIAELNNLVKYSCTSDSICFVHLRERKMVLKSLIFILVERHTISTKYQCS